MKRLRENRRGVALMLVLSSIAVLTAMGIEFAYNTSIYYNLAVNEGERLKAAYLARSAYNFMRLELKFDQMFRKIVQRQNLGQYLGANAQLPLCQQFPLSTGLIRAVFAGGLLPGMEGAVEGEEGAEAPQAEDAEGAAENLEDMRKDVSISQEKDAMDFLSFEGDFDGECIDEGTKIDLNGFAGLSVEPGADGQPSPFDQYKQFLFRFLSQPRFRLLFEEADVRALEVVNNIGDWIDDNSDMNDFDGRSAGAESSLYQSAEVPYQVRNGKLITLLEAYLIDGVKDVWFEPLMENFTIYGDGTVNVCQASEDVVESLIRRYVDTTPGLPPLRLEDPEEMGRLTTAITEGCASGKTGDDLKQEIATALNTAIGSLSGEENPTEGQGGAGKTSGFAALVNTESRFFQLKLTGQVNDTMVRIKAVLDAKDEKPEKWRLLYWREY